MSSKRTPAGVEQLIDAGASRREAEGLALTERGPAASPGPAEPTIAVDYVHTVNPDTGVDVVFTPGDRLPAWAAPAEPAAVEPQKPPIDYQVLPLDELHDLATARGIDTRALNLKADYVTALEATEEVG